MAGQNITFDFLSRGAATVAGDFRKTGDNAAFAAKGAKILGDAIDSLGKKEDRTAAESRILAKALRETGDAEDRVTARAVLADAAVRKLDDDMKAAAKKREAELKVRVDDSALKKLQDSSFFKPSAKGTALSLSPALIPLAGATAGAIGAIGVSFGAAAAGAGIFGLAASSVLSGVSSNLAKLQALEVTLNKATTPAAKKTAQAAIDALKATWSKGYLDLINEYQQFKGKWTSVSQAIAVPALLAWMPAMTKGLQFLIPAVTPVASLFKDWGQTLNRYFSDPAVAARISSMAAAFGRFSAGQLSSLGVFFTDVARAVFNLGRDLAAHGADFGAFSVHLDQWGGAFLRWSQSAGARRDVGKFLDWIRANGPTVTTLLKNLGGDLALLAPGLAGAGTQELKVVTDLLGLIAKLPPGVAKPLTETAVALLLLSKLGVVKVGIQVVGAAAKWLSGGAINLGGGAAAGAEIRTAMVSGGAAAAAEIRAAMTAGGAAAGGGGLAGAAGSGAVAGKAAGGGFVAAFRAAISPVLGGVLVGALIRAAGDSVSPAGSFAGNLNKQFQADGHMWSTSLLHSFTFGGLEGWLTAKIGLPVGAFLNGLAAGAKTWGGNVTHTAVGAFADIAGGAKTWWGNIAGTVSKAWGTITGQSSAGGKAVSAAFGAAGRAADALRTGNLVPLLGETGKVSGGIQGLAGMVSPRLSGAMDTGGAHVNSFRTNNLGPLQGSLSRTSGGVQGLQGLINAMHGKTVNVGVHASGSGGMTFTQKVAASISSGGFSLKSLAGGGLVRMGSGPTADDVPAMLSKGELVVPAHMVKAGAADNLRGRIPGFAGGGIAGLTPFAAGAEYDFGRSVESALLRAEFANLKKAVAAAAKAAAITASKVPNVGSGVARWKGTVDQALRMEGLSTAFDSRVLYQMQTESGGNPNAINLTDSNAARGTPSKGLMQVIAPTFARWHWPGTSGNIYDPLANIAAAINYARHTYGPQLGNQYGGIGSGHGYALGGLVPGYASGGTVAQQGQTYLNAWRSRHGGPYALAIGPKTLNQQIPAMAAAAGRAKALAGAGGLSPGQHKFWAAAAAGESRLLATLRKELGTEQAWRGQLGSADTTLAREIAAAGNLPALAPAVKGWKAQIAAHKYTIGQISGMTGLTAAQAAAAAKATPSGPPASPVPVTHTYGGDVANNLGAVLQAALGPFTGAAKGGMVFDSGGTLRPGFNPVWNMTGRPESLVPARGGGTVRLEVSSGGSSEFDQFMTGWLRKHVKVKGGGSVQHAFGSR